jgi:hypothetical protein
MTTLIVIYHEDVLSKVNSVQGPAKVCTRRVST